MLSHGTEYNMKIYPYCTRNMRYLIGEKKRLLERPILTKFSQNIVKITTLRERIFLNFVTTIFNFFSKFATL